MFSGQHKAQIGSFVLLGLVIIGAVAGYYAYSNNNNKSDTTSLITENQNLIRESIRHMIEVNTLETLKYMENHGAYDENVHDNFVTYLGDYVPVWQMCDKEYIPKKSDIEEEMENMLTNKLIFNKDIINQGFFKNVTF